MFYSVVKIVMWSNMKTNIVISDYNQKTKDEHSSEIIHQVTQLKDFFNLFGSENEDLALIGTNEIFQNLYILSRVVINRPVFSIDESYQLMSVLFYDDFGLNQLKEKFDYFQNNLDHLRTLHQNLLKLSQFSTDFRVIVYNFILNLISIDINLNENIIDAINSIFNYREREFDLNEFRILVERYSSDAKIELLNQVNENLFFQYQKIESFQANYLNSFIRFSIILLYIVSGDFNDFDKKYLNRVLKNLNLIEIDDELEDYYSKKTVNNISELYLDNRSRRMLDNINNYFKITDNIEINLALIKALIVAISIKGFVTSQQEIFIEFMSDRIGGKQ